MQLELQLRQAEFREKLAKRVVVGALVLAVVLFPILALQAFGSPDPYDKSATAFSVAAGVTYAIACVVAFVGLASYYSRFVPRVRQSRDELLQESIRELRREVSELRQMLAEKGRTHKTDQE